MKTRTKTSIDKKKTFGVKNIKVIFLDKLQIYFVQRRHKLIRNEYEDYGVSESPKSLGIEILRKGVEFKATLLKIT